MLVWPIFRSYGRFLARMADFERISCIFTLGSARMVDFGSISCIFTLGYTRMAILGELDVLLHLVWLAHTADVTPLSYLMTKNRTNLR
ncbi:MAG: hypothetical protein K6T94_06380 [Paenibacillus sp.]|nr:hypothetical protein [Paenibacillus sp.]